ncbi:hypothetical protein [uncultured Parasphingorhabdus sp.]|uniref:hypothetical protein n=1 Tax=uncultured Parasphingorhabdus sp. TaxID=2709694 RepID=UPI002AA646DA|nr:hypothetical protein [uncultured Parasphingorhabdus sp.]
MAKPLEARIASAIESNRVTTTNLSAIIDEIGIERDQALARHEAASAESVNFALNETDRDDAALQADRASRSIRAFENALEILRPKLAAKQDSDSAKARKKALDDALAARDALADKLRVEWPEALGKLTSLLSEITINDRLMASVGRPLDGAEAKARGIPGNFYRPGISTPVERLTKMKIPAWDGKGLAWPPPSDFDHGKAMEFARVSAEKQIEENRPRFKPYKLESATGSPIIYMAREKPDRDKTVRRSVYNEMRVDELTQDEAERLAKQPVTVTEIDAAEFAAISEQLSNLAE